MPHSRFTLVPAAYVFLLRDGAGGTETLLQLRQGTGYMDGYWACGIAGHVEAGESVLATAAREAREEVGAVVEPADLEPLTTMHRTGDPWGPAIEQRVDFFFTLRRWGGALQVREPDKSDGLRWFPLTALPELVPPHERHVLGRLTAELTDGTPVPSLITFGF